MFLRKRLLKAKSADQFAALLLDELRRIDEFRDPLFVHEKKISEYFAQTIAPITEIVTSKEFEGNLSGGVLTFAQAGGSRRSGSSATLALTPMNQLVLLEHAERERGRLIDLASGPPAEGMLLSFVGDGRIFVPGDQVREDPGIGLGAESAAVLERERKKREAQRGQVEGWESSIVWVASGSRFASITGYPGGAAPGFWTLSGQPPFGILGRFAGSIQEFALISALAIWQQPQAASPRS